MIEDDCKQRFKGMEKFLRKIAFNLGNTPSQTEVKVISCIPIDVTDLQQKIIQLEKQLEAIKCNSKSSHRVTSTVRTAIYNSPYPKKSNAEVSCKAIGCCQSRISVHNENCSPQQNISSISLKYLSERSQAKDLFFSTDASEITYTKKCKPNECRKNFFNKKKFPKKKKLKTQMIYYAQTENKTPFNNYGLADDGTFRGNEKRIRFNRSYLTDMVRKQYLPRPVDEDTNASNFSTPICRDVTRTQKALNIHQTQPYESDMCSCCHGRFQNIDHHISKRNQFDIFSSYTDSTNSYYDSNLYDIVPVKENNMKVKNIEVPKRREPKNQMNIACWPGNLGPRYKIPPISVNYSTVAPTRQHIIKKVSVKPHSRKEKVLNKMSKKDIFGSPINRQIDTKDSKTHSVEVGEVYKKQLERRRKVSKPTPKKVKNHHDVACLTTVIVNTECQTTSDINANSQENKNKEIANVTLPEDKTKVTLNQIKDILQSVLNEVKTNNKISNSPGQSKKKDAVVQNGLSQSNMYGGSSLIKTFTYSPHDMDPYGLSCSQQKASSNLCYRNIPSGSMRCMQHYPLFVQPGRNMCASCYRNNLQGNKLPNMKRAASTATNTEELRTRNKETENLIKEIYKAMALNIEMPTESPVKEHGDTIQTIQNNNTRTEDTEGKDIAKAISEIFKSTNPVDTSVSQKTDTPFESKVASNETSSFKTQPEKIYTQLTRKIVHYHDVNSETIDNDETEQVSRELESDEDSDSTVVNASVSETESEADDVVITEKSNEKKEKKGMFSKMLKILMPRRRKHTKQVKGDGEQSLYIDSRTTRGHEVTSIPSHKTTRSGRPVVFFSKGPRQPRKQSPETIARKSPYIPYMEQEYRRYFDEKLTFHDSRDPMSSTRGTAPRKRPVYYQKVEARSALVDYNLRKASAHSSPRLETKSMKPYSNQNENYTSGKSNSPEKLFNAPHKTWLKKYKLGNQLG